MYYNAIQAVLMAHKFLALSEQDRARVDPLMNAFNLKDAREYVKKMVHLYPGVWRGCFRPGEWHCHLRDRHPLRDEKVRRLRRRAKASRSFAVADDFRIFCHEVRC